MDSGFNEGARIWGPVVIWGGVTGVVISAVFLAPATAILCLGVSFLGLSVGATDACDETCASNPCIPNEFPHNE